MAHRRVQNCGGIGGESRAGGIEELVLRKQGGCGMIEFAKSQFMLERNMENENSNRFI